MSLLRRVVADAALDRETIERMQSVAGGSPILVGLSGGGDSTALLHLLAERFGAASLRAVVIDHALRAGAAEDAARAAGFAEALGVPARVVRLAWPDGPDRAQAAARQARYRALCDVARSAGVAVIALGHTRDDQAETVFLRAAAGSAWRGLVGMRGLTPAPIWPEGRGLWVARPLLRTRRAALRALLDARRAAWIEDPANVNLDFARVRARARLAAMETAGLDPMRLAALAETIAPFAAALDSAGAALIQASARFEDDEIEIDRLAWQGGEAARQRALSVLVAAAAGAARAPAIDQVAALETRMAEPGFKSATLAGALVQRRGGRIRVRRDPGALRGRADGASPPPPLPLSPGRTHVWDGRVALTTAEPGWALAVEGGAPVLAKQGLRAPLALAAPQWLLRERVMHLLPA